MKEKLLLELITICSDSLSSGDSVDVIKNKFSVILNNYEITEVSKDIQPYSYYPEELKLYLISRNIEGISDSTIRQYKFTLERFFSDVRMKVSDVDTNTVRLWLYKLKSTGVSDRYLDWNRTTINSFYNWCVDNELVSKNPARGVGKIKYVKNRKSYLTQEEMEEIRQACDTVRDRMVIEVYYSTAMRCSELTTVKIEDIDLTDKTVTVLNKKGKRYKTCYLNEKAVYWIKKYMPMRSGDNPYLLQSSTTGNPITTAGVENIIRKLAKKCNIDKKITPGTFRHTAATQGLANGMSLTDVQTMLDHKNPATTLVYADIINDDVKSSHRKAII